MSTADRSRGVSLTRREALALGIGAFAVVAGPLAVRRRPGLVRRTVPVMGTVAEFAVVPGGRTPAQAAIDAAVDELRRVERLMTRFSETSDVGRANRLAAVRAVVVSGETALVLGEALAWAAASDGRFDPALGRLIRLWNVGERRTPPPEAAARALAGRRLYREVELDTWRGEAVVRFTDRDVEVDLGGIAKGYGVDRAVAVLRREGVRQAIVNVGGDLYALGASADEAPWRVGIRSPEDPDRMVETLEVRDAAVATSGDYLQYFQHGGRRYHHLLDPVTGEPHRTPVHSVTVRAGTCLVADAAATAVFGMGDLRAATLLEARAAGARVVNVVSERA